MLLARRIVEAVISGRVEERFGWSRSMVTVTFADGSTESEVGRAGIKGMFPQRGWTSYGNLTRYEAYRG